MRVSKLKCNRMRCCAEWLWETTIPSEIIPSEMMNSRRIPTCIVGYGYWGPNMARNIVAGLTTEPPDFSNSGDDCPAAERRMRTAVAADAPASHAGRC